MMPAALLAVSREFPTLSPFFTGRNNGPSVIEVACSQFFTAFTGQFTEPRTIAMTSPFLS
jgi:hypothetical protein